MSTKETKKKYMLDGDKYYRKIRQGKVIWIVRQRRTAILNKVARKGLQM